MTQFKSRTASLALSDVNPTDLGYVFPEPAMFLSVQKAERQDTFFRTWLKYRSTMIYRISSSSSTALPMPNAVCRNFLTLEAVDNKKVGQLASTSATTPTSKSMSNPSTRAAKLREMTSDFLQNCLDATEGVHLMQSTTPQLKWNGVEVGINGPNNLQREEILWELADLNFRFELLALDSRATTGSDSESERQALVSACFPNCTSGSLLVADLGAANHGLASENWEEKALYLHALKRVMMSWRGEIPGILRVEKVHWHYQEIIDLEDAISSFYVASFYQHFRRPPIVPRALSHSAAVFLPPALPEMTVLNPKPNVFYDLTSITPIS
jgi:hypothetical protein